MFLYIKDPAETGSGAQKMLNKCSLSLSLSPTLLLLFSFPESKHLTVCGSGIGEKAIRSTPFLVVQERLRDQRNQAPLKAEVIGRGRNRKAAGEFARRIPRYSYSLSSGHQATAPLPASPLPPHPRL